MENLSAEEDLRALPDRPPRYCPACNARVADGATVCLMCGASLEEPGTPVAPEAPARGRKRLSLLQILVLAGVAVAIIGIGALLSQRLTAEPPLLPTATPTITETPTPTLSPTPTATPTLTPTPTSTPTPVPPQAYIVQAGDALLTIALQFGLTVDEIKTFNGLTSDDITAGQTLYIPAPTPTPGPTPTLDPALPTPTLAPYVLYTVKSGDVLSTIAQQYGVSVAAIQAANNLSNESTMIKPGQVLQIPQYTPTPERTAAVVMGGTPTPRPIYGAPTLLYPPDGAEFTGAEAAIILQWTSVGLLDAGSNEYYRVELNVPSTSEPQTLYYTTRDTIWRLPATLFPAPELAVRRFSWRVVVVQQGGTETDPIYTLIGQRSPLRTFTWKP